MDRDRQARLDRTDVVFAPDQRFGFPLMGKKAPGPPIKLEGAIID